MLIENDMNFCGWMMAPPRRAMDKSDDMELYLHGLRSCIGTRRGNQEVACCVLDVSMPTSTAIVIL